MPDPALSSTPSPLRFRLMEEGDIPHVSALASAIWQAYYPPLIGQAQTDYMDTLFNAPESLRRQRKEGYEFLLAEKNGITGYAASRFEKPGELYISKFYVDHRRHGSGIGTAMMEELLDRLRPASARLHVNARNYPAINFYFKTGFRIAGMKLTDIGNGFAMDDFVMQRGN